ncbi:MAG TPA: molybdopterin dinucleotide binding domain-containing protein [Thermoanaerobaculaceae bacterium]|nr:molybdopterin dinucleotide binding domain-containing protein [Thermoanaerobaculaceae bacterium]
MKTRVSRRDVLRFASGSAIGLALSPLPWKLTDDLAIWTQNWSWIPRPPRGELANRFTTCTLCPAGCAVRARCVGDTPVSLHGLPRDPLSGGTLCPLGSVGHHLAYHPARVAGAIRQLGRRGRSRAVPVQAEAAVAEVGKAIAAARARGDTVAVLDGRPGSAGSWALRRFASSLPGAVRVPAPGREGRWLEAVAAAAGDGSTAYGCDLERAGSVISFGALLSAGWGAPGRARALLARAGKGATLIEVDSRRSASATAARRLAIASDGEEALALGLAHVLLADGLVDPASLRQSRDVAAFSAVIRGFTPERVAERAGVEAGEIVALARTLAAHRPSLALGGEDPAAGPLAPGAAAAVFALDVLLGSVGGAGGLVPVRPVPPPEGGEDVTAPVELEEVADGSVGVLLIDASAGGVTLPWHWLERKLVGARAVVAAFSPYRAGLALRADLVFATPAYLEAYADAPTPAGEALASYAVAAPLLVPRAGAADPIVWLRRIAAAAGVATPSSLSSSEQVVRSRVDAIHRSGRGSVVDPADGSIRPIAAFASPEALLKALVAGGRWVDDAEPPRSAPACSLLGACGGRWRELAAGPAAPRADAAKFPLRLQLSGRRDAVASAATSPVTAKLYRESGLRSRPGTATVNPATARAAGLRPGQRVRVETGAGALGAPLACDAAVLPGVVEVAVGPDGVALGDRGAQPDATALDLAGTDGQGGWRSTPARLVEA